MTMDSMRSRATPFVNKRTPAEACWVFAFALLILTGSVAKADSQVTTSTPVFTPFSVTCSVRDTDPLQLQPGEICTCKPRKPDEPVTCLTPGSQLTKLVDAGTSNELLDYLAVLEAFEGANPVAPVELKGKNLRLVWLEEKPDGTTVSRQIIHQSKKIPSPVPTLPGVKGLTANRPTDSDIFDILIDFNPDPASEGFRSAVLKTLYVSEKKPNPLLEQIPGFVKQLGFMGFLSGTGAGAVANRAVNQPLPPSETAPPPQALFTVTAPDLPERRAEVNIRDFVVRAVSLAHIKDSAEALAVRLKRSEGRQSTCAGTLAKENAIAIAAVSAKSSVGAVCELDQNTLPKRPEACQSELEEALAATYVRVIATCLPDAGSIGHDPVASVRTAFNALVSTLGFDVAKGEGQFHNVPRDTFSFGLVAALRVKDTEFSDQRVKIGDDGNVKVDPLPRLLSMVVVNWHPLGYDPSKLATYKDRGSVKVFGGTTISPDFGLAIGGGYSPIKGLSVNFGWGWLFINVPREGVLVGSPVPADEALRRDPFRRGSARTLFWGLSYSLQ